MSKEQSSFDVTRLFYSAIFVSWISTCTVLVYNYIPMFIQKASLLFSVFQNDPAFLEFKRQNIILIQVNSFTIVSQFLIISSLISFTSHSLSLLGLIIYLIYWPSLNIEKSVPVTHCFNNTNNLNSTKVLIFVTCNKFVKISNFVM
jgi:hypothetical protein